MARSAVAKARPSTILIFHDGFDGRGGDRTETVVAVRSTIEGLLARGYRFVAVDKVLGVPAHQGSQGPRPVQSTALDGAP